MTSLAARLMPAVVTVMGTKRRFEHPVAIYRMMHARQLRPDSYAPPRRLDRTVRLSVRYENGWPVYDVVSKIGTPRQRILFLHGGGYISQIVPLHWRFVADLARRTAACVTVPIYPLAPLGTADSVVPAVAQLAQRLAAAAGAERLTLVGDSAGGGMALAAAQLLRDRHAAAPRLILISPWLDVTLSDPAIAEILPRDPMLAPAGLAAAGAAYRGGLSATDPLVSPLFGDLLGLGRILLFSGTRDILNADARRLALAAASVGVDVDYHEAPEMLHVYPLLPTPEGRRARAHPSGTHVRVTPRRLASFARRGHEVTATEHARVAIARAGLYLATFMAVFDIAVVYLALPDIERSIGAGISDQQWIASAYGLMEAAFALAAGTLGDLYGRKRVYIFGVLLFILGSIGSGLAPTPAVLIGCRFVQGIGGAIAMALPLAILVAMSNGHGASERSIRMYATVAGLGAVTAPALGGIMVQTLGWRSVFFVNVPISLFVLYAALAKTAESPRDRTLKLDLGGQLTSILGLFALSFSAIEGNVLGWRSPPILAGFGVAIAAGFAFAQFERFAPNPMIKVQLLRQRVLAAGAVTLFMMNVGFFTLYLITSLFLQNVKLLDPLRAGWFLLVNNLAFFLTNQFGGVLTRRLGERVAAIAGMVIGAAGLALFAAFDQATPAWLTSLPLALTGFGWGLGYTPVTSLAMSVVSKADTGFASGLLGIGRPLGAVTGTAVFGSLLSWQMHARLVAGIASPRQPGRPSRDRRRPAPRRIVGAGGHRAAVRFAGRNVPHRSRCRLRHRDAGIGRSVRVADRARRRVSDPRAAR